MDEKSEQPHVEYVVWNEYLTRSAHLPSIPIWLVNCRVSRYGIKRKRAFWMLRISPRNNAAKIQFFETIYSLAPKKNAGVPKPLRNLDMDMPTVPSWPYVEVRTIPPVTIGTGGISSVQRQITTKQVLLESFGSSTSSRPLKSWFSLSLWKSGSIRSGKAYSAKVSGNSIFLIVTADF